MHILITRPEPDASRLAATLSQMGHHIISAPLMVIDPVATQLPDFNTFQAVLLTSANGARALHDQALRDHALRDQGWPERLPAYCVGEATAQAARSAGAAHIYAANGDVVALAQLVTAQLDPAKGALLHVAGSHRAGDLAAQLGQNGFAVERLILYKASARSALPANVIEIMQSGGLDAVMLFSPRSAALFQQLVQQHDLLAYCADIAVYCMSEAVADVIRAIRWRRVIVAAKPQLQALLSLL